MPNDSIVTASTTPTETSETETQIRRLTRIYNGLADLIAKCPMSDATMGTIIDASMVASQAIIDAPIKSEHDLADKFRFVATLIEQGSSCSGEMADEYALVMTAVTELATFRNETYKTDTGEGHPLYDEFTLLFALPAQPGRVDRAMHGGVH